jgi:N-acylglucosamine 2-epimerase
LLEQLETTFGFPAASTEKQLALDALEGSLEFGWDKEFGGLPYFMDIEGKPTLQLESSMKLWWPHTEAIYALVLAYKLTGQQKWLQWLEKVDGYAFSHFADAKFGEWFGYCDRRGNLTHTCKGGNYKGFFHVPRFLLMSIQAIDRK